MNAAMAAVSPTEKSTAAALARVAALPRSRRVAALVDLLAKRIEGMDTATLRRQRAGLVEHFATCGCSLKTVELMAEWVDCQLALRRTSRRPRSRRAA